MKKKFLTMGLCMVLLLSFCGFGTVSADDFIYADGEYYAGDDCNFNAYELQLLSDVTVYFQGGGQSWSSYSYGYGTTIAGAGCGLLALTNAVYHLNGNFLNPTTLADFSLSNGYRVQNNGTAWAFFQGAANHFGSQYQFAFAGQTSTLSTVKSHLQSGGVATCRKPGHFMSIVDYDASTDKYLLLDSAPSSSRGTSSGYAWKTATQLSNLGVNVYFMLSSTQPQSYHPEGNLDGYVGGNGTVTLSGWAFDRDDVSQPIGIHIYIGSECVATTMADVYRPDVHTAFGVGEYHGYQTTFQTNKIGTYTVDVYAINIGGGSNIHIGAGSVTISPADAEPPVISDIKITNITENGYTVSCTVTDNSGIEKVVFPTWTNYNIQDDIIWHVGTVTGNTASYTVNIADHNNEHGTYATHIYAYDVYGNSASAPSSGAFVPMSATATEELVVGNRKYILFENENTLMWHEAKLYCEQLGGYLVTVTSEEEQETIKSLISKYDKTAYYLGGTDAKTEGAWEWVTGEKWEYTNWSADEPNNNNEKEHYLGIYGEAYDYKWNDFTNNPADACGFICEIELPTEEIVVNHHKYIYFDNARGLSWLEAEKYCNSIGGHLATITSEKEQETIKSLISKYDKIAYYLGGTDQDTEGTWEWVTGEKWEYANWHENEPNNADQTEHYLGIYGDEYNYQWNDFTNKPKDACGFICEIVYPHTETTGTDYGAYKVCKTDIFQIDTPCFVVLSSYFNNRLVSVETREVTEKTFEFAITGEVDTIKIMVWDSISSMKPLCEAEVIPASTWIK